MTPELLAETILHAKVSANGAIEQALAARDGYLSRWIYHNASDMTHAEITSTWLETFEATFRQEISLFLIPPQE